MGLAGYFDEFTNNSQFNKCNIIIAVQITPPTAGIMQYISEFSIKQCTRGKKRQKNGIHIFITFC